MEHDRLVAAWEPEHGDIYLAELIDASARGHDPAPNPIVRILTIIKYPMQRAITDERVPHETPPLGEGTLCRLPVLPSIPAGAELYFPYEKGLELALDTALREARSDEERAILQRHKEGSVRGKRAVLFLHEWQI